MPGWTLPGVMNAGAVQVAMKSGGAVPSGRVVLAGGGPLLLLVACQLLDAGVEVAAIVETSPARNRWQALGHLPRALRAWPMLSKGLAMIRRLRRERSLVPARATGASRRARRGARRGPARSSTAPATRRVDADLVLLHHGVIPNTQLPRLLRVEHAWSDAQLAWQVVVDAHGQTSLPGFASPATAPRSTARSPRRPRSPRRRRARARPPRRRRARAPRGAARAHARERERSVRPFLDALYRGRRASSPSRSM